MRCQVAPDLARRELTFNSSVQASLRRLRQQSLILTIFLVNDPTRCDEGKQKYLYLRPLAIRGAYVPLKYGIKKRKHQTKDEYRKRVLEPVPDRVVETDEHE